MGEITFLLIVVSSLTFMYAMACKLPGASEQLVSRLICLIPSFEGRHGDVKSAVFCFCVLTLFVILFTLILA